MDHFIVWLLKNKADYMNGWERSMILWFFQIDAFLKCEDPLTAIKIQLEYIRLLSRVHSVPINGGM